MDRLDELLVFTAIIDTGSLAAAGRRLKRSPPAITRSLAALEERLALRLLERSTRRIAPTEAGRRVVEQARHLLGLYAALTDAPADDAPRGQLRVTAPVVFGRMHVTPLVTAFQARFPAVRVDLVLADRNLDMIDEELDVAVRIGALADSAAVARRVGQVHRVTVASPAYLARHGTPAEPAALTGHDVIFTASRAGPPVWDFAQRRRVRLSPRLVVNQVEATLDAARAGHGIARALSYQTADDIAAGRLIRVLQAFEPPPAPVHLMVPSVRHMPARVRAFLDHAATSLMALPVLHAD